MKDKTVTIVQQPSDTPVVYSITVEPASLTFEAEGAATQKVTVMTEGEGLTWRTEVDEAARGWLTVTEGEGQFAVAVSDNPDTVERAGNITVIPSEESASPKVVRVVQKEKVIPLRSILHSATVRRPRRDSCSIIWAKTRIIPSMYGP